MKDLPDARVERDTAMAAVDEAAAIAFKAKAYDAIVWVARTQDEFISDDVWNALDRYYPGLQPAEARVMGPLMRKATAAGVCEKTGAYRTGRRRAAHATPQPIYRSLMRTP